MYRFTRGITGLVFAMGLIACAPQAGQSPSLADNAAPESVGAAVSAKPDGSAITNVPGSPLGVWVLRDTSLPTPPDASKARLTFEAERLGVRSGCNTGGGAYRIVEGKLIAERIASTMMACPPPLDAFERGLFALLQAQPVIAVADDELVLESGEHRARFQRAATPSTSARTKFIYVASERKACTGVIPMQCLQVRERPEQPWSLFYGNIEGFEPEPGVEYRLRILEEDVPNAPADGSTLKWWLDLVVEQKIVTPRKS